MFDNSGHEGYELVAQKLAGESLHIENDAIWNTLVEEYQ